MSKSIGPQPPSDAQKQQNTYHRLVANGRGRSMTRPSWMDGPDFATLLGDRPPETCDAVPLDDGSEAEAPPPIQVAILSRVIILRNAFDPKRLVKNKYLSSDDSVENGDIGSSRNSKAAMRTFPDVEKKMLSTCAQYGFVRYVNAWAEPSSLECVVRVGFAKKEAAKLCCDAWHGKLMPWGVPVVADFELKSGSALSCTISKAIWIGNVFQPVKTAQQALQLQSSFQAAYRAAASAAQRTSASDAGFDGAGKENDEEEEDEEEDYFELMEKDFAAECSRFGPVSSVSTAAAEGCVHVVFGSVVSAGDALHAMHGRWFEERLMWAEYDLEYEEQEEDAQDDDEDDDGQATTATRTATAEEGGGEFGDAQQRTTAGSAYNEDVAFGNVGATSGDEFRGRQPTSSSSSGMSARYSEKRRGESSEGAATIKQQRFAFNSSFSVPTMPPPSLLQQRGCGGGRSNSSTTNITDFNDDAVSSSSLLGLKSLALPPSITIMPHHPPPPLLTTNFSSLPPMPSSSWQAPLNPYAAFDSKTKTRPTAYFPSVIINTAEATYPIDNQNSKENHGAGKMGGGAEIGIRTSSPPDLQKSQGGAAAGRGLLGLVDYDSDDGSDDGDVT